MRNKNHIVVTGGAGFIGSHIAARLIKEGHKVTILDNLHTGKEENIPKGAEFLKLDMGREESYGRLNGITCDAVFHLAGQSSGEASFNDPLYDLRSHVLSTFWLLEWCKKNGIRRFIYASSMNIYGDPKYLPVDENHPLQPKTFYAASKISAEAYIRLYQTLGIDTTVFRLFSVYGPGQNLENMMQGMLSIYLSYMLSGEPVIIKGSGKRFRDFVYVDDVVDAWLSSLHNPAAYGKVYNIASGQKTTVEMLIGLLREGFNKKDYPVEYREGTPGDQFGVVGEIALIRQELKWQPRIDIKAGIDKVIKFEKRKAGRA